MNPLQQGGVSLGGVSSMQSRSLQATGVVGVSQTNGFDINNIMNLMITMMIVVMMMKMMTGAMAGVTS